MAGSYDK
ncbi:hypothetical protein RB213_011166 [Colletotrichum asianum]